MKKTITMMLAASLTVAASHAAPLAKRIIDRQPAAEFSQADLLDGEFGLLRGAAPGYFPGQQGNLMLFNVDSPAQARNMQAAKSAQAASRAISAKVDLIGQDATGIYSKNLKNAFVHIPTSGTTFSPVVPGGAIIPTQFKNGGYYDPTDNTYNGFDAVIQGGGYMGGTLYKFDMATGQALKTISIPSSDITYYSIACQRDPSTGKVYGYFFTSVDDIVWGEMDYFGDGLTVLADAPEYFDQNDPRAFICTPAGDFYCLNPDSGLYKIDKADGSLTLVANPEIPDAMTCKGAANPDGTSMILVPSYRTYTSSGVLEVDLTTGAVTEANTLPFCQFYNIYVAPPLAADKAPDAPQLTLSAPEGSMTVGFNITIPSTLYDGTPLQGAVEWVLTMDGELVAEGKNMAGAVASGTVAVDQAGVKKFIVSCSNAEGKSPDTTVEIFVGKGTPVATSAVTAAYADGTMTINWAAVTQSADGGYIDPAEVTYDVACDGETLAAGLTANNYAYSFEAPMLRTLYTYEVVANYDGKSSAVATSNTVALGAWTPPYAIDFKVKDVLTTNGFTILDANADAKTWAAVQNIGVRCNYNFAKAADDWLFTPEIYLEAGKAYAFTMQAFSSSTYATARKFEVKAGKGTTAEDMTLTIVADAETKAASTKPDTFSGMIIPDEDGLYNIGIHSLQASGSAMLTVTSLDIAAGVDVNSPKAVSDFVVTPDAVGSLAVKMTGKMPTETVIGTTLTANLTLQIVVDGEVIYSAAKAPGATLGYTINMESKGDHELCFRTFNGDAQGVDASETVYVGPYRAQVPSHAEFFETHQPGTVTVVWAPVTKDIKGTELPAANVTYQVWKADAEGNLIPLLDKPTSAMTATFKATDNYDVQQFCQFYVGAYNLDEAPNSVMPTNFAPVGRPYELPVSYTTPQSLNDHILGADKSGGLGITFFGAASGIPGADDSEFFGFQGSNQSRVDDYGEIFSGMLNLTAGSHPEVTLSTYKLSDADANEVSVIVRADNVDTEIARFSNADAAAETWTQHVVSLAEYNGKNIQVVIRGTVKTHTLILVDAITISEHPEFDLAVAAITAPVNVNVNQNFAVTVEVENNGWADASNFDVNLYRDGDMVETRSFDGLAVGETLNVVFDNLMSYFDAETSAVFSAEIVYGEDMALANNITKDVVVKRRISRLTSVNDLTAETTDEGTVLTWTPYDPTTVVVEAVTEDFENSDSWATELEDWTFLDLDGEVLGGFDGIDIPCIKIKESTGSYFIFDNADGDFNETFAAASGNKFLASMFNYYATEKNDWAISPRLSGDAQTVTFMARSYQDEYPEIIKVYVSYEDSLDPDDYDYVGQYTLGEEWTEISIEIEEGQQYFAIASTGNDTFMLLIDDVTFIPASALPHNLVGYDVYRNGLKIGSTDGEGSFVDTDAPVGKNTYHVVARYQEGNSELSNPAEIELAGLTVVENGNDANITVEGRDIVVTNADGLAVAIATIDGKLLLSTVGNQRFTVLPAVYLVTVDGRTVKVLVK